MIVLALLAMGCNQPQAQTTAPDPQLQRLFNLQLHYQQQLAQAEPAQQPLLAQRYQQQLRELAPAPTAALSIKGVRMLDQETLLVDGDVRLDRYSFSGAVSIWLLNRQAEGYSLAQLDAQIQPLRAQLAQQRGVYLPGVYVWRNKIITYRFAGYVSTEDQLRIKAAMTEWENASKASENAPAEFSFLPMAGAAPPQLLTIEVVNENQDTLGSAHVGAYSNGKVQINRQAIENFVKKNHEMMEANTRPSTRPDPGVDSVQFWTNQLFLITVLHELGHSLGLQHEHQRWDRNTYILPALPESNWATDENSALLPLFSSQYSWKKLNYGNATIEVPISRAVQQQSCTPTAYDYHSIMHYAGFRARQNFQEYRSGEAIRFNRELSPGDRATIARLYQAELPGSSCP